MIPGMRLYFARHGESEANVARVIANRGWAYPLTDRGRAQALRLARRLEVDLRQLGPDTMERLQIHASPLRRAAETADIVATVLGAPVVTADALREADCGVIEGRSDPEAWAAHDAVQARWRAGATSDRIDGGESLDDVLDRIETFVHDVVRRVDPDAAIVCVGHGSVYRFALPVVLVGPVGAQIEGVEVGQAGAVVAEVDGTGRLVEVARWAGGDDPVSEAE
jgi:broad specificity phosphatase PhoE